MMRYLKKLFFEDVTDIRAFGILTKEHVWPFGKESIRREGGKTNLLKFVWLLHHQSLSFPDLFKLIEFRVSNKGLICL